MKVCHLTSAHPQEDIRIFEKECVSLAAAGYETYQISCGKSGEKKGVKFIGIGEAPLSRKARMIKTAKQVYLAAVKLDADIYHFHDPELLPYGLKLKKQGKKVIFDSHEDVPGQIRDKEWIPKLLRRLIAKLYEQYETHVVKRIDAVVVATAHIGEKFRNRAKKVAVVNNYPRLDDIAFHDTPFTEREAVVCYAGGIEVNRGEQIMIEAMKGVDGKLLIAGDHEIADIGNSISYIGRLNRTGINELYGSAVAGLCILKPIDNYFYSKPIKVYEYMAAGLPYICSDFPGWRKVAEESGAGVCVDPENIQAITETIKYFLENRNDGQEMGKRGREYVLKQCNWSNEEQSLLSLYQELTGKNGRSNS